MKCKLYYNFNSKEFKFSCYYEDFILLQLYNSIHNMTDNCNNKTKVSIQHIICEVPKMGLNAMVRAAEISTKIHDRTIGVVSNAYSFETVLENGKIKELTKNNSKWGPKNTSEIRTFEMEPNALINIDADIDLHSVRYSILFKNAEINRRRLIKIGIESSNQQHQIKQEKKKTELSEIFLQQKQLYAQKRFENDNNILKEANRTADKALTELIKKKQNVNSSSQKNISLKDILDKFKKLDNINLQDREQPESGRKPCSNLTKEEGNSKEDFKFSAISSEDFPDLILKQYKVDSEVPGKSISLPNKLKNIHLSNLETLKQQNDRTQLCNINAIQTKIDTNMNLYGITEEKLQFYNDIMLFYNEKAERADKLQNDENAKEIRSLYRQAIYTPINSIGSVSAEHLRDKYEKLLRFMTGHPYTTAKGTVTVNSHPLGPDYCVLLMVKKFVNQGENSIASNPQSAYAFASVAISLWKKIPYFGQLLLAHFFKKSPFLVPYFIPENKNQSVEDYCKQVGYYITDGQIEDQSRYLTRLSGLIRLYSALMITAGTNADETEHPFGIEHGWQWLCDILNVHPLPDICATLILEFLQTVGWALSANYGKQFNKLIILIQFQYFPKLAEIDQGGPKSRLEVLLTKILSTKQVPRPVGLLSPNFW